MIDRFYRKCPNCGQELYFLGLDAIDECTCGRIYKINTVLVEIIPDPRIFKDGDQWCALYGENIQEGICGFGSTPDKALNDYEQTYWGKS